MRAMFRDGFRGRVPCLGFVLSGNVGSAINPSARAEQLKLDVGRFRSVDVGRRERRRTFVRIALTGFELTAIATTSARQHGDRD